MPKIWAFFSPKGGVGKSTFCVHLAESLAARGKSTVLVDASPVAPALDILCGISESVVYTLSDVADNTVSADRALLEAALPKEKPKKNAPKRGNVFVLPVAPFEKKDGGVLTAVLDSLSAESKYDIIIVDASLALYEELARKADALYLCTDPSATSVRAAEAFSALQDKRPDGFLLMRASLLAETVLTEPSVIDVIDRVSLPILGIIPYASLLASDRLLMGKRYSKEPYSVAVANIAARLLGDSVPLLHKIRLEGISRRAYLERTSSEEL